MAIEQTRMIGIGSYSGQSKVFDQARKRAFESLVRSSRASTSGSSWQATSASGHMLRIRSRRWCWIAPTSPVLRPAPLLRSRPAPQRGPVIGTGIDGAGPTQQNCCQRNRCVSGGVHCRPADCPPDQARIGEQRGYPEELKLGGTKTMTEMVDRFQQGLDELVQKGARQGQAQVLHRQVTRRFGEATAGALSGGRIQRTPSVESPTSYPDFADSGDRWPFLAETGGQAIEGTSSIARLTLCFVLPQVWAGSENSLATIASPSSGGGAMIGRGAGAVPALSGTGAEHRRDPVGPQKSAKPRSVHPLAALADEHDGTLPVPKTPGRLEGLQCPPAAASGAPVPSSSGSPERTLRSRGRAGPLIGLLTHPAPTE